MTRKNDNEPPVEIEPFIRAAIKGNEDAFGYLYEQFADKIYQYFFYRVHSEQEAQDLTAQVFLNAWKAISRYHHENVPFLVWLYAIARNLLINHTKANQKRSMAVVLGEGIAEQVADQSEYNNPIGLLVRQADNQALARAFEKLNEEQQQVIYYRFVENWSHAELALLMKKSEGAIRALQFRALETLRRLLTAEEVNFGKTNR